MWMFHVTPALNIPLILRDGLLPMVGERSAAFGEAEPAVAMYVSPEAAAQCFEEWMSAWFEDDEAIAILAVDIDGRLDVHESLDDPREARSALPFESGRIRVLSSNLHKVNDLAALVRLKLPSAAAEPFLMSALPSGVAQFGVHQ
jgi:hypothetical protein